MELTVQINSLSPLPEIFVSRSTPDYLSNFPWPVTCFLLPEKSEPFRRRNASLFSGRSKGGKAADPDRHVAGRVPRAERLGCQRQSGFETIRRNRKIEIFPFRNRSGVDRSGQLAFPCRKSLFSIHAPVILQIPSPPSQRESPFLIDRN